MKPSRGLTKKELREIKELERKYRAVTKGSYATLEQKLEALRLIDQKAKAIE